ncbi:hypothetical protein ACVGWG_16090, partial [Enterobacter asburiae]
FHNAQTQNHNHVDDFAKHQLLLTLTELNQTIAPNNPNYKLKNTTHTTRHKDAELQFQLLI